MQSLVVSEMCIRDRAPLYAERHNGGQIYDYHIVYFRGGFIRISVVELFRILTDVVMLKRVV